MADKKTEQTEQVTTAAKEKVQGSAYYRCMADSFLEGVFYQRGKIYELPNSFVKKYPELFKTVGVNTPDTSKVYDPAGDSIKEAKIEKYSAGLFTPPQPAPHLGIPMED